MFALVVVVILISTAEVLPWIFTNDAEVHKYSSKLLHFVGVIHLFDALQSTYSGVMISIGAQIPAMIICFLNSYVIGLTVGLCLMLKTSLGLYGIFKFLVGSNSTVGII